MVAGANTGIGQGIALAIGRAGGNVIGVGRSSMEETETLFRHSSAISGFQFHTSPWILELAGVLETETG